MADLLLHLMVPGVALLALYNRKYLLWIIALTPLTQLQAIDHLQNFDVAFSRAGLHNVFTLIPFILIAIIGYTKKNDTLANIGLISTFYWLSHIILDLDGVKALWPLSNEVYKLTFNIPLGRPGQLMIMSSSVMEMIVYILAITISIPNIKKELTTFLINRPPLQIIQNTIPTPPAKSQTPNLHKVTLENITE